MSELEICENCRFYFYKKPYVEIDMFGNERKGKTIRYCKWIGKNLREKHPACGIFKLFKDQI